MSTADAFSDLIAELRSSARPVEELATEIAADYGVNPAFLTRKFSELYPNGLPPVDPESAARLQRGVEEKERKQELAERAAILDFFAQTPSAFRSAPRAAQRIVAQAAEGEVLRRFVQAAIAEWACRYTTRDEETVSAARLDEVQSNLTRLGLPGASRLDMSDFERVGVRVVEAQYTGGVRPTGKFIRVAVLDQ